MCYQYELLPTQANSVPVMDQVKCDGDERDNSVQDPPDSSPNKMTV